MSNSNDPQQVSTNVGFDGRNITINDTPITDGDYTNLITNSAELLGNENIQLYMMIRTICDIIKDATNARVTVSKPDIIDILKRIFPEDIVNFASENTRLEEIKAISNNICKDFISGRVFIKSAYTDHIPLSVDYVFNESGAEPDTFSRDNVTIMSSFASVADPATRTVPTSSFPGENKRLYFYENFMSGLVGFLPQTTWDATQTSVFNDNHTQYSFGINVGLNGGTVNGNNVTNDTIAKNKFGGGYYFQGNPTKNKFINNNLRNIPGILPEILRYMIIKEMGDMMQVYVMLVWYVIIMKNNKNNKNKFVMSTTDLVVMNTCQLFQMPCLYTNQGKDSSMLSGQEKIDFDNEFEKKMLEKANGPIKYKNWKKNNKFANTLYYLPFEESSETLELKKRRRLDTIYYVINTQNQKQLDIFKKANIGNLRYIKMGRLGPLMTSFSNDIITEIITRIIQNIEIINHNLFVKYNELVKNNQYNGDETDIELKKQFSLHILITRQKYPPTVGNTYVFVIQNLTHYTEEVPISDGTSKLVDMMLDTIKDNNINRFNNINRLEEVIEEQDIETYLNTIFPKPKISGPGPNENWLIYSIANWFNGVRNQLNTMFGDVFQPFDFSNDDLNDNYWMGVGGKNHNYQDNPQDRTNKLGQPYMNIGFVTMMPSIYEQLCSIYEKHNIVYDDVFGQTFIRVFISNLTRYYQDNQNIPTLKSPYNNIDNSGEAGDASEPGTNDKPHPYSCNLIPKIPSTPEDGIHGYKPYEKCVIHTDDIDFDIENIEESNAESEIDVKFKQELIVELDVKKLIKRNKIYNSVFTVDDDFALALFQNSGITFNELPQLTTQNFELPELPEGVNVVQPPISNGAQLTTPPNGSPEQNTILMATPITSPEDLQIFLSPEKSENEQNKKYLFSYIITPLKQKQIEGIEGLEVLENISPENILEQENSIKLIDILKKISNDNIILNDDPKLKQTIKSFIERGIILPDIPVLEAFGGTSIINGNKKTRRRNKRSHKKHDKTNKKHKKNDKHKKSGKNKTRKVKKAKRKNKTV